MTECDGLLHDLVLKSDSLPSRVERECPLCGQKVGLEVRPADGTPWGNHISDKREHR